MAESVERGELPREQICAVANVRIGGVSVTLRK